MYLRGHPEDYEHWERDLGLKGWGWKDIGRLFREIEDHELGANEYRGVGGPLNISQSRNRTFIMDQIVEAGEAMGLPKVDDTNMPSQDGIGYVNTTIKDGRRCSAAKAFLDPARTRGNLTIVTDCHAQKILFEGSRAIGVECSQGGQSVTFRAGREVILSTGTIRSPQILQLSGIGPADHLRSLGIPVISDSPQVGENLREHCVFRLQYRLNGDLSQNKDHSGWRVIVQTLRYYASHTGILAEPAYDLTAFVRTHPGANRPDAQLFVGAMSMDMEAAKKGFSVEVKLENEPGVSIIGYGLRPESRGSVQITSADTSSPPRIIANFLTHPDDEKVAIGTVRYMRELFEQPAVQPYITAETLPGPEMESDEDILAAYRTAGGPGYHPVGTCRMGADAASVVDEQMRVRGASGLRVIDASIFPTPVSGNTNGPTMVVAARAAEVIMSE